MKSKVKNNNNTPKEQSKHCLPLHGIFGILALFVFVSIVYSTVLICLSFADKRYWIGLAPAVGFALWLAIYKFAK